MIPKVHLYGSIDIYFSFSNNGLLINELNDIWHQQCLASMLSIDTGSCIIGIFFDRELASIENTVTNSSCRIFKYNDTTELEVFKHYEPNQLNYQFIPRKGIVIGNIL